MFFIGVDLGKRRDHTAIAVVERVDGYSPYGQGEMKEMLVRYLERAPLGTSYTEVAEAVRDAANSAELRGRCSVVVDATGLGGPVVDMLRGAGLGCEVAAVTITGGEKESQSGWQWNVPKQDLIAGVQVLLERGELRIAEDLRETGALVQELVDVRMSARGAGRVRLGADGYGEHDDLVIALALACWRGKRRKENLFGKVRLF